MLNQILEQKTSTHKTGLGFDAYAHSKSHAPIISKSLGNGKFEIANETKKTVFKSAGTMSSSNQENVNVASIIKNIKLNILAVIVVERVTLCNFVLD